MGRYNHWLRNMLADRIEANGGYSTGRRDNFPLSWDAPLHNCILSVEEAVAALIQHQHVLSEADLRLRCPDYEELLAPPAFASAHMAAAESMRSSLIEDAAYRTWSPATAARYGFDYTGKGADMDFHVQFAQMGRQGKHVCLEVFERLLAGTSSALADCIRGTDDTFRTTNVRCRQLMGMMDEWDKMFSRNAVEEEFHYQQAWYLAAHLELT